jgi:hypothetical protein
MKNETEVLRKEIEMTFEKLIDVLSEFDEEGFNQVPFAGSWTAGQTAEHIIICGSGLPDGDTTESNRAFDQRVKEIKALFLNYDLKFETDPSIAPGPGPHDKEETIRKIREISDNLIAIAASADLKALCHDMEFPGFGLLTRYEWLNFINFHTKRHTHQIINIAQKL